MIHIRSWEIVPHSFNGLFLKLYTDNMNVVLINGSEIHSSIMSWFNL